jgi:hypothetical protein
MKIYFFFLFFYKMIYTKDIIDTKITKLQSYFHLLYPSIKDIYPTMDTINKVLKKKDEIFIYGVFEETNVNKNIFLFNYLNKNIMREKILQLVDHKKLIYLSISFKVFYAQTNDQINLNNIKIHGIDNLFLDNLLKYTIINNNVYSQSPHKITNMNIEEIPYEMELTEQEKKIYIDLIQHNIQVKFLLFLLDNFDKIYPETFVIFSPFNANILTQKEAKILLTKSITLYLYKTIFNVLY